MQTDQLKAALVDAVQKNRETILRISEALFEFRETALQEYRSADLLCSLLEQGGFFVERGVGGMETAFRAVHGCGGPAIAILAEMDALPELGHACGHNIIAAAAVGAGLALREVLPEELAKITILGCPAEETGTGKIEMIRAGVFQEQEFAMMVHPSSKRQVIKPFLGLARIRFHLHGKAAHAAAYPEDGINALDGVIQIFNGVNALRQHLPPEAKVHGIITEGGKAPNIIPDLCSCFFYVRAETPGDLAMVRERLVDCARGAALATGCRLEVEEDDHVLSPFRINRSFAAVYSGQLAYLGLSEWTAPSGRGRGSSDIGNVSQVLPTIHPHVPIGDGARIHTPDFALRTLSEEGKTAALEGAAALALTAVELACSASLRERVRREFFLDEPN